MKSRFIPDGRGVLVTGCSSGIGRATALHLARKGFTVFASTRNVKDAGELERLEVAGLIPVQPLDLAKPEHVPAVVSRIEGELAARGKPGLYAIVNNAGAGEVAPIELLDLAKLRNELEARIVGPIALLQAFLPSLRRGGGRIVWIATPSLIPIPFVSSIHACDFAANCIARTLSIELSAWRIPSLFVRCGGIQTAAPAKNDRELEEAMSRWPRERLALYADALKEERESLAAFDAKRSDPMAIAEKVRQALLAERPKRVYRAGHLARLAAVLELLPQALVDGIMRRRMTRS